MEPSDAFVIGLVTQIPVALIGMMAAFNWSAFRERGILYGAKTYRNNSIIVIVFMIVLPLFLHFI